MRPSTAQTQTRDLLRLIPHVEYDRKVVAFYSYKGGVGRTMALCNVAARLAARLSTQDESARVLCADFDIEAPGVPAFFPPPKEEGDKRGVLGLLLDCRGSLGKSTEELEALLFKLLQDATNKYVYCPHVAENIVVLPVGNLHEAERGDALKLLSDLLSPAERAHRSGSARGSVPFFAALRNVFRRLYTYTLIDSRTGLADTAFGTTVLLADSLVLLFRPHITHLMAVQRVLGQFLYERGLVVQSPDIPVIPVISPRPTNSAPDLVSFRKIATSEVFKWLLDDGNTAEAPLANPIIELPFDSSLQVGERLLVESGASEIAEDPEAPLYRAYLELASAVQVGNAKFDFDGSQQLELAYWESGNFAAALPYALFPIAAKPNEESNWDKLTRYFSLAEALDPFDDNIAARSLVFRFCSAIEESVRLGERARFFAALMLTNERIETRRSIAGHLQTAWQIAQRLDDERLVALALERLSELYEQGIAADFPEGMFPRKELVEAALARKLLAGDPTNENLWRALLKIDRIYRDDLEQTSLLFRVLHDEVIVAPDDVQGLTALGEIADTLFWDAQFRRALALGYYAWANPLTPRRVRREFPLQLEKFTDLSASLPEHMKEYPEMGSWAGFSAVRTDAQHSLEMQIDRGNVSPARKAKLQILSHLAVGEDAVAEEEATRLVESSRSMTVHLALQSVIRWLRFGETIPSWMARWAEAKLQIKLEPLESVALLCLLAADPHKLADFAKAKLVKPLRGLTRFEYTLLATLSVEDGNVWVGEVMHLIEAEPLLAPYCARRSSFPIIARILKQLATREKTTNVNVHVLLQVLSAIEDTAQRVNVLQLLPKSIGDEPFVKRDRDFEEIRNFWSERMNIQTHGESWASMLFTSQGESGYST